MCARTATPSWSTSKWNGDGVLLTKALEAGAQLLAAEGATVGFHADLIWPDGKETVDSADAARAALKLGAPIQDFSSYIVGTWTDRPDVSVFITTFSRVETLRTVRVAAQGENFALTQAAFSAVADVVRAAHPDEGEETPAASDPVEPRQAKPRRESRPVIDWLESHQGVIAAVGVFVAVVSSIVAVLLAG